MVCLNLKRSHTIIIYGEDNNKVLLHQTLLLFTHSHIAHCRKFYQAQNNILGLFAIADGVDAVENAENGTRDTPDNSSGTDAQ